MRPAPAALIALIGIAACSSPAVPARAERAAPAAARDGTAGSGERASSVRVRRARVLMGTLCTAVGEGADTTAVAGALEAALDEIARLEALLSPWRADSELSRLNAAGPERRIECSPDLFAVLDSSLAMAAETDGAFDPTVEPLTRAWDLRGAGRVPDAGELAELRARVGWRRLQAQREPRTVRFQSEGMGLDFGGIAKGYALDRAAGVLRERGVACSLLNLGGEILAFSDRAAWDVWVADPGERLRAAVRLPVRRAAVSTSGQGERFFTSGGRRYGHVLDPLRGVPVEGGASVTVVTRSGTRADGLSTALLVMGREKAEAFVEDHRGIGALWLERDGPLVRAWRWNLPAAEAATGTAFRWMN